MKSIAVVSAGISSPSSTRLLADKLALATGDQLTLLGEEFSVKNFELRTYAHEITNALVNGFVSEELSTVMKTLEESTGVIFVTPIFTTSYSGLFKSFIDILELELLQGKPVLLGATGGTARHSLALDYALRPLFTYLHAEPVSTGVFASSEDWGAHADDVAPLQKRVERGAKEFAQALLRAQALEIFDPYSPESYDANGGFEALLNG